jgi:hypothetical protein
MNLPFRQWKEALTAWNDRSEVQFRRLALGQDDAFDLFKGDDLQISVLGPFLSERGGVTGLKLLGIPPKGAARRPRVARPGRGRFRGILGVQRPKK